MLARHVRLVLGVGALFASGCVDEREPLTNIPPGCKVDAPCSGPTGGGIASGSSSGGGDAGISASDVTGSLLRLTDNGFTQTGPYAGPATIRAAKPGGGFVETQYEAGAFKLSGVAIGEGVLFEIVDDAPGAPEILSTINYRDVVGSGDQVTLVAANEEIMSSLAGCLGVSLDPASAHAVLRVVKNDFPFQGATVTDDSSAGVIAYQDPDPMSLCGYQIGGASTGANGLALLLNIPVPADNRLTLEVSDGVDPFSGVLDVRKGTVTYTDLGL